MTDGLSCYVAVSTEQSSATRRFVSLNQKRQTIQEKNDE